MSHTNTHRYTQKQQVLILFKFKKANKREPEFKEIDQERDGVVQEIEGKIFENWVRILQANR